MADRKGDESSEEEPTITEDVVVTKYKMAGDMANRVLGIVISNATPGTTVKSLCEMGDKLILEETGKVFKKEKELKKGIAFPTCVSVNHCICHFSPVNSDPEVQLKDGDVVKFDLGVHIDGFIAVVGHTAVVGASVDNKVTGRKADVIVAAHTAAEAALRLVKPGNENQAVTDAIQKVSESFKCKPIEGMMSHQLKKYIIDGEKSIILNPSDAQRKEHDKCEFEVNEVYAVDVLVSTSDGKSKELDIRTTVYKKTNLQYSLKMKASRAFFSELSSKFTAMPFTLRAFEDETKARMGVVECVNHGLVEPFNVLWEKEGEFVAQFKFTLLLMPSGPMKITGGTFDSEIYQSEYSVEDEDMKALLSQSANRKGKKKKKKSGKSSSNPSES